MPAYKVKGYPRVCVSYRAIKLLEQPIKVFGEYIITCSLASCLVREPLGKEMYGL